VKVLAGGLDLVAKMTRWEIEPLRLVSLGRIPGLDSLEIDGGGLLHIGPMTALRSVELSPLVRDGWPLLWDATRQIASVQVKTTGTLVGNLCVATPASDIAPALCALGGVVHLVGPGGAQTVAIEDFFVPDCCSILAPDQIVAEITVPPLRPGAGAAFKKLAHTKACIAKVNVAALVERQGDVCRAARIALGAVASTTVRARAAEDLLEGAAVTPDLLASAATLALEAASPISDLRSTAEYRRDMVGVLTRRALTQAWERSGSLAGVSGQDGPATPAQVQEAGTAARPEATSRKEATTFIVNGRKYEESVPANMTLLELLRDHLGLTGTKRGCSASGNCGACTVLIDGKPTLSCLTLARTVRGRQILTVEGLSRQGRLHPLQRAFLDVGAVQCGFCTPGMLLSAKALLDVNPSPTRDEVRQALAGNLCRCTGYVKILDAVLAAAAVVRSEEGAQGGRTEGAGRLGGAAGGTATWDAPASASGGAEWERAGVAGECASW
jgi:xanthine dehydrogenase iron-sulfur cluster and FAD-binding subunit A